MWYDTQLLQGGRKCALPYLMDLAPLQNVSNPKAFASIHSLSEEAILLPTIDRIRGFGSSYPSENVGLWAAYQSNRRIYTRIAIHLRREYLHGPRVKRQFSTVKAAPVCSSDQLFAMSRHVSSQIKQCFAKNHSRVLRPGY